MAQEIDRPKLGARLKEAREYAGYSQEEVAKFLGVPRPAVSLIESGTRRLGALELQKLANLYDCSMDDLTGQATEDDDAESVKLVARAAAKLSPVDRSEVLRFAQFLRTRNSKDSE